MANVADLNLIQIGEFPKTDTLAGSGPEYVVLTKADGVTYGMLTEDFKAFLGTVQVQVPKALAPTDPAPTLSGVYYPTVTQNEAGTPIVYGNAGGIEVNTAEGGDDYGKQVQLIYDGANWVKVDIPLPEVDTSNLVEKSDIVNNLSTDDPEKPLSANMGAVIEPRILPEGQNFKKFDRPDLDAIFEGHIPIGEDGRINETVLSKKVISFEGVDRPDLQYVRIDKNGKVVYTINTTVGDAESESESFSMPLLYNPPLQEYFYYTDPFLTDYSVFTSEWDKLITDFPTNPDLQHYVTKTNLGKSSTKNLDIWRYDLKPADPRFTVILLAGTHASEKIYLKLLHTFCRMLVDPSIWSVNATLEWLKFNVHFVVVPCVSPSAISGFEPGSKGGRRPWETDDFPVSWTKTGTVATVTFNAVDFPDTNGRLDANTYFSYAGLAGKLQVALFGSSDITGLPNDGYVIQSVVNGRTITVETGSSTGATSGTARMYVGVDPNRNMDVLGSAVWTAFTSSSAKVQYTNDHVGYGNDNKGTKPFSLAETIVLRNLFLSVPNFDFIVDEHSGSGRNYLATSTFAIPEDYPVSLDLLKNYIGQFSTTDFSAVRTDIGTTPFMSNYIAKEYIRQGYTIEWAEPFTLTAEDITNALRWKINVITQMLKIKK